MSNKNQKIFIVNHSQIRLEELTQFITDRFGSLFIIKKFSDNDSAINAIDLNTAIIVFDNSVESVSKDGTRLTMNNTYSVVKYIMRTSNEEIEKEIDDYCSKKSYFLFRKGKTWERTKPFITKITKPIKYFVKEYLVRKYVLIFFITFLVMGIGIYYLIN